MRSNLVSQHVPLRIVTSCVVLLAWAAPAPAQQQIVWPHQFNNRHYAFLGDLAIAFDADSQTPIRQVEFRAADKASVGRFADKDDPFAALIDWPATKHGEHRLSLRFPAGDTQPVQHVLAQRRVIVVASRNLYLERISRAGLRWLLRETETQWPATIEEDRQRKKIRVVMAGGDSSWLRMHLARSVLRENLEHAGRSSGQSYRFRGDIIALESAQQVLQQVRGNTNSIGVIVYQPDLDYEGVDLLQTRNHWKEEWAKPNVVVDVQADYQLGEQLGLYVHPSASVDVIAFAQWVTTQGGTAVFNKHGWQTPYGDYWVKAKRRLKMLETREAARLSMVGVAAIKGIASDLAIEMSRAKDAIGLDFRSVEDDLFSVKYFVDRNRPASLLLLEGKPSVQVIANLGNQWNSLGEDGTGPRGVLLAGRASALIVHASNKLNALTLEQVRSIYSGKLSDWSVIGGTGLTARGGGESVRIHPLGIGVGDPSAHLFREQCLKGEAPASTVQIKKDTAEAVAAVSVDPQAIAFVDWASIPRDGQTVKVLAIMVGQGERAKPITPSAETIKNAMYPLSQRIYMYVHPDASDAAKGFAEFLATGGESAMSPYHDSVQAVMNTLRKHGLVSLSEAATKRRIEAQLKAAQAEHDEEKVSG